MGSRNSLARATPSVLVCPDANSRSIEIWVCRRLVRTAMMSLMVSDDDNVSTSSNVAFNCCKITDAGETVGAGSMVGRKEGGRREDSRRALGKP